MNNEKEHLLSTMVILPCKHFFTDEELLGKSNEIAQCVAEKEKLEAEKKTNAAEYKNKIDKESAAIKLLSGHINNKYATVDRACELFANFETKLRQYKLKDTGEVVKEEPLHASDYNILQRQLDLDAQVEENNEYGDFANADPIDAIIEAKKGSKSKEKPAPKMNLGDHYNKDEEFFDDVEHVSTYNGIRNPEQEGNSNPTKKLSGGVDPYDNLNIESIEDDDLDLFGDE